MEHVGNIWNKIGENIDELNAAAIAAGVPARLGMFVLFKTEAGSSVMQSTMAKIAPDCLRDHMHDAHYDTVANMEAAFQNSFHNTKAWNGRPARTGAASASPSLSVELSARKVLNNPPPPTKTYPGLFDKQGLPNVSQLHLSNEIGDLTVAAWIQQWLSCHVNETRTPWKAAREKGTLPTSWTNVFHEFVHDNLKFSRSQLKQTLEKKGNDGTHVTKRVWEWLYLHIEDELLQMRSSVSAASGNAVNETLQAVPVAADDVITTADEAITRNIQNEVAASRDMTTASGDAAQRSECVR
eukprot:356247-Chlamydomonas_euryale.AAC.2